ncbi:MAG: sel1 repeat family protein [Bacilli bacterium]|nr:sel1 repeat family protein [Bacilli bacterium]
MKAKPETTQFDDYARHSKNNEIEILNSKRCGCFFCRGIYDARNVKDWSNDAGGASALCPECGVDAVIGDASGVPLDKPLLKQMNQFYFGIDFMEKHPEAARVYCQRYLEKKVAHKEHNETLFLHYLGLLAQIGDEPATLVLGDLFSVGDEFVHPDDRLALHFYQAPCLSTNPHALVEAGHILQRMGEDDPKKGEGHLREAYECYAKAASLGSLSGRLEMAVAYLTGSLGQTDFNYGFQLLKQIFQEAYRGFCFGNEPTFEFVDIAYELGLCYYRGEGVKKDHLSALRYFLFSDFALRDFRARGYHKERLSIESDLHRRIRRIAKEYHYEKGEIIFDQDTFYDSFADIGDETFLKKLMNPVFDEQSGELEFDVEYVFPPLVVDLADLSCAFASERIHWHFTDVASWQHNGDAMFETLSSPDGDSWSFDRREPMDGQIVSIASLHFRLSEKEVASLSKRNNPEPSDGKKK